MATLVAISCQQQEQKQKQRTPMCWAFMRAFSWIHWALPWNVYTGEELLGLKEWVEAYCSYCHIVLCKACTSIRRQQKPVNAPLASYPCPHPALSTVLIFMGLIEVTRDFIISVLFWKSNHMHPNLKNTNSKYGGTEAKMGTQSKGWHSIGPS